MFDTQWSIFYVLSIVIYCVYEVNKRRLATDD